jgi:hypothetical protein
VINAARLFAHWPVWLSCCLLGGPAFAFEVERADARYQDKEFRVELELVLNAPADRIEAVLRDYASYPSLDASILEARVLDRPSADTAMLYTKLRACSGGLFCRTVNRVERVQESSMDLLAVVVPERSDVLSGSTHTQLQTVAGGTRIRYTTSVAPKFWLPGFLARPLMLRTLREASLDLFRKVEIRAKPQS